MISQSIHIGTTVGSSIPYCFVLCRVDLEKRRAEKERAEKGHVPSGIPTSSYPPFPASDMGWGKELGQVA
ncbi:hypothetical protein Prudu_002781 [Prunus dulcis]|uniref:Uncharacterized protein n=1 Tax=Prunus dulcis TaxID=3755 RepID=A0A4Y1QRJ7_PRUDU|nr:hypothetical protein Prudu_002781 [Prunus dulcis]